MKTIIAGFLLIATAMTARADEPDIALLEKNYAESAEQFRQCLEQKLSNRAVTDPILEPLRMANKMADFKNDDTAGLKLTGVSTKPPVLRQDPNDLYRRYQSVVVFHFQRTDATGALVKHHPYEVTLPAFADPQMKWAFPDCEDAMLGVIEKVGDTARAIANVVVDIKEKQRQVERLTPKRRP